MYKETVKFFIRKETKEAYPVLKGGSEVAALEWSKDKSFNRQLDIRVNNPNEIVEVENKFNKIQVTKPISRGKGGKLFKCKLFFKDTESKEDYVVLDLRTESLFSVMLKGTFLEDGIFMGNYAMSSNGGTYQILNLDVQDSTIQKDYAEYLEILSRNETGNVRKNELGLDDLIEGHIYTKVAKGKILDKKYLYLGRVLVKENDNSQSKPTPVYFDLQNFYSYFRYAVNYKHEFGSSFSDDTQLNFIRFFKDRVLKGYILKGTMDTLLVRGVLAKTSNKFYADISEDNPLDLSLLNPKYIYNDYNRYNGLNILSKPDKENFVEKSQRERGIVNNSVKLIHLINDKEYPYFETSFLMYPIKRLKMCVNMEDYIGYHLNYAKMNDTILEKYLTEFDTNEQERLQVIKTYIENKDSEKRKRNPVFSNTLKNTETECSQKTLNRYRIDKESLELMLEKTKNFISELSEYT